MIVNEYKQGIFAVIFSNASPVWITVKIQRGKVVAAKTPVGDVVIANIPVVK